MPLGKGDREEEVGPSAKKGKQAEEVSTYQKKKKSRSKRKYKTLDYPIGKEQGEYDLVEDL